MTRFLAALILIGWLAGCASTPYQRIGTDREGGYSSSKMGNDRFMVNFAGNTDTKPSQAYDFALLRSAELTLEAGYVAFVVESERDNTPTIISTYRSYVVPPRYSLVIRCYSDATGVRGKVYRAADVVRELKAKYHVP
jgi:hypothetical protein